MITQPAKKIIPKIKNNKFETHCGNDERQKTFQRHKSQKTFSKRHEAKNFKMKIPKKVSLQQMPKNVLFSKNVQNYFH